jgi:hypothetical protein
MSDEWTTSPIYDIRASCFTVKPKPEWLADVHPIIKAPRKNNVPTHDPYANPNAYLYYECKCGMILDPATKSFAGLNNAASEAGWKVRFGEHSYVPYCVECGKDVQ